jgi:hypothetical protein
LATNTYVALATHTVPSSVASYTFTSIPQGYTDLILVINGKHSANQNEDYGLRFNSDTGSNYSSTYLLGSGTAALSGRVSNQTKTISGWLNATDIGTYIDHIQNYSNSTTYKTVISRGAQTDSDTYLSANVSLWRNTAAITSITVVPAAASLASGMTLSLYGVAAEGMPYATGGYVTSDANYYYHTFTSTGTFTPLQSLSCDYLVVAGGGGGGGGGAGYGGGGGAGGYRTGSALSVTATPYTITVGAGGVGGLGNSANSTSGSNSVFSTITSNGGGLGGGYNGSSYYTPATGGSGGGSGGGFTGAAGNTPSTSPSQGNSGGNGSGGSSPRAGGGGGGASASGTNGQWTPSAIAGNGGNGSTWSGNSVTYAGGGAGGVESGGTFGTGGSGGGGGTGVSGTANTGGGGGGAAGGDGRAGGSGIVVIRYPKV